MLQHGSIIWAAHAAEFDGYNLDAQVVATSTPNLTVVRESQTEAIQTCSYSTTCWVARGQTNLRMGYPELALSDAYKALRLFDDPTKAKNKLCTTYSKAKVLLCEALFFAQCLQECLDKISTFLVLQHNRDVRPKTEYRQKLRRLRGFVVRCLTKDGDGEGDPGDEASASGQIRAAGYPWLQQQFSKRSPDLRAKMAEDLLKVSGSTCTMKKSRVPDVLVGDCYGAFANVDFGGDEETVFMEKPTLAAGDRIDKDCCKFCFVVMDFDKETSAVENGFCKLIAPRVTELI